MKNLKKLILFLIAAAVAGAILGLISFGIVKLANRNDYPADIPLIDDTGKESGCYVSELFAYDGVAINENGMTRVENAAAVNIVNNSSLDIRYAEIKVQTGDGEYVFLAVSWLAGSKMTVLTQELDILPEDFVFVSAEITGLDFFDSKPSLHEDKLKLSFTDGVLTAENLTDTELRDISVYFKTREEDDSLGGATFKVKIRRLAPLDKTEVDTEMEDSKELEAVFVTLD